MIVATEWPSYAPAMVFATAFDVEQTLPELATTRHEQSPPHYEYLTATPELLQQALLRWSNPSGSSFHERRQNFPALSGGSMDASCGRDR